MVDIQGGLGCLFLSPDLLGDLTFFAEEKEEEHIYHPYPDTHPYLAPLYYHMHLRIAVMMLFDPLYHFHYPQITGARVPESLYTR